MNETSLFISTVKHYYQEYGRDLPWRHVGIDAQQYAYQVLVSEVMLQQTQVPRVVVKYQEWLQRFPTIQSVAEASLIDVLAAWSGLGYNRRAKYLHQTTQMIVARYNGIVPQTIDELCSFPGIGYNTAAAILVYAYNQPHGFVETNIRTVYLHHFFQTQRSVSDTEILASVYDTIDTQEPREWYWALMDYGTFLKRSLRVSTAKSKMYKKQSAFIGSDRQLRGMIIRSLIDGPISHDELLLVTKQDDRTIKIIDDLLKERMITKRDHRYLIP